MAKSFRRKRWVLLPTKSVIAAVVAMIVHNRGCHVTKRKRFTDVRLFFCYRIDLELNCIFGQFFTEPVPQYALIGNGSKAPKLHLWTKDGQHERCTEAPVIASSTMHPLFVICAALAAGMSFHLDHPSRKTLALLKVKSLLTSDLPPEFQVGEPAVQPFLLLRQLHPKREHDLLSSIGEALLFTGHEADFLHPDADSTDHDSEDSETTSETDEFDGSDLTAEEIASIEEWTRKCAEVTFEVLEDAPIGGYANEPCRGVRELLKLTDY